MFQKQESDEVELPGASAAPVVSHPKEKKFKGKTVKILCECVREGIVNFIVGDAAMDGNSTWEKCRLILVKTSGGFLLEFYSPPKVSRPKFGVSCLLIAEARETTALELPDKENTFVLKSDREEYIIEAEDTTDRRDWLMAIRECQRSASGMSR